MTHALVAGDAPERTPGADGPAPRALLDAGLTRFARYGATADRALTEHDEHAEQAVAGVGVMGGGLREPELLLPRFETAAHVGRPHTPQAAIALNPTGGNSTQAAPRHLPGITAPDIAGSNTAGTDVAVVPDVAGPDLDRSDAAASEVAESDLAGLRNTKPLLPRFKTATHLGRPQTPQPAIAPTPIGGNSTEGAPPHLPGITEPDIARPHTAAPDIAAPDIAVPEVTGPGVAGSDLARLRNMKPLPPRRKTAAHLARPQTPQTAITFTTSGALEARGPHRPGDSRQAASRHLPGITAPDNGGSDAAGSDVTGSDVHWPDVAGLAIAAPEVAASDAAGRERASR